MAFYQLRFIFASCLGPVAHEANTSPSQGDTYGLTTDSEIAPYPQQTRNAPVHGLWSAVRLIGRRMRQGAMDSDAAAEDRELADSCLRDVAAVFPDVYPEFLSKLASSHGYDANAVINHLVDQEEEGKPYPRRLKPNDLKRKRSGNDGDDDEAAEVAVAKRMYSAPGRKPRILGQRHVDQIQDLIRLDYPQVPVGVIRTALAAAHHFLLQAYVGLYETARKQSQDHPWISAAPHSRGAYCPERLDETIQKCLDPDERDTLMELRAARHIVASRKRIHQAEMERKQAEKKNFDEAQADGLVKECECCFGEFALNRLAQCSAETAHWFCFQCGRRQVETLVGLSRYQLACMSMDGCEAGFSHGERQKFLDEKLASALDRIEQEAVLRLADLEDLVSCPFCPFAAECDPTEVDREFRCQNPDCQIVSCRLCNKETHVPKTCEQAAKDHGYSARRTIEEAMSAAMIRRCNKCGTPFIKENGCNKMMCCRQGCRNVQCYVCSESCDYAHFNDPTRGGKEGNCPLFDSAEVRHAQEIKKAEEETRKRVTEDNPDIDPELLKFHMSEDISRDEKQRTRGHNHGQEAAAADRPQQRAGEVGQRLRHLQRAWRFAHDVHHDMYHDMHRDMPPVLDAQGGPVQSQGQPRAPPAVGGGHMMAVDVPLGLFPAHPQPQPQPLMAGPYPDRLSQRIFHMRQVIGAGGMMGGDPWHMPMPRLGLAAGGPAVGNMGGLMARGAGYHGRILRGAPVPANAGEYRGAQAARERVRARLAMAERMAFAPPHGGQQRHHGPMTAAAAAAEAHMMVQAQPLPRRIPQFPRRAVTYNGLERQALAPGQQQQQPAPGYVVGNQPWLLGYEMAHHPPVPLPLGWQVDGESGNLVQRFPPGAIAYANGGAGMNQGRT